MYQKQWGDMSEEEQQGLARAEYFRRAYHTNRSKEKATAVIAIIVMVVGLAASAFLVKGGLEAKKKYEFSLCCEARHE